MPRRKPKVLIIFNQYIAGYVYETLFRINNFRPILVLSEKEMRLAFKKHKLDLIVIDFKLKKASWGPFLIKVFDEEIPVLFFTEDNIKLEKYLPCNKYDHVNVLKEDLDQVIKKSKKML